jgi:tRNA(Ser,Leu) C12 N-acetylase TAN1
MPEANLLITFEPVHEKSAKDEILALLKGVKETAKVLKIEEGLAEVSVKDARKAIKNLRGLTNDKFMYTFYWWPVDKWCKADIKGMQTCIKKLQEGIKKSEKWKLDLAKRKTKKEYPQDIIIKLTEVIDKPNVDLSSPDKIIKVEIIGGKAAVSLLAKNELLKGKE